MKVFAIGDLHLALENPDKGMDVFGAHWKDHWQKISADWRSRVSTQDVVLVPGDISWAMKLEEAQPDLDAICAMPGKKILLRGNHDFWWDSATKVRNVLHGDTHIIQNDCLEVGEVVICGSRLWNFPMDTSFSQEDEKIFEREKGRLQMSLDCAKKVGKPIIAMTHFPPLYEDFADTDFTEILSQAGVAQCVFGHLHGPQIKRLKLMDFDYGGVLYNLVSADYLDFQLKQIV